MDALERLFGEAGPAGPDLEALLRLLGQELFHYARVLTGSPERAEDALQDLLVVLLEQGAAARQIKNPRAWLFTVLRRKALGYRREQERAGPNLAAHLGEAVETDPAQRLLLAEAFGMLDRDAQEIALLHLWEGLTFAEIAQVLGIPRGTALSHYHRGILELRRKFGSDCADAEEGGTFDEHVTATLPG